MLSNQNLIKKDRRGNIVIRFALIADKIRSKKIIEENLTPHSFENFQVYEEME